MATMAGLFAMRYLVLCMFAACALGSHFRGGVVMVRPISGGEKNEVGIGVVVAR